MVAANGHTKWDYIINRLLDYRFSVASNSHVQKTLRQNMGLVYQQVRNHIEESRNSRQSSSTW